MATLMILILGSWLAQDGAAAIPHLEYVSPQTVESLAKRFGAAPKSKVDIAKLLTAKKWRCEIFGIRSRFQVRRNVGLYDFSCPSGGTQTCRNRGAQPVESYEVRGATLIGISDGDGRLRGTLRDEIHVAPDGTLISRLSLARESSSAESPVVAYSVCQGH